MRSTRTGQRKGCERAERGTKRPSPFLSAELPPGEPGGSDATRGAETDRRTEQQIDRQTEDLIVTADAGSGREDADEADPTARIASGWWTRASGYTLH